MVLYVTVGGLNSPQGKFCIFPCTEFRTLSETDFWIYRVYKKKVIELQRAIIRELLGV